MRQQPALNLKPAVYAPHKTAQALAGDNTVTRVKEWQWVGTTGVRHRAWPRLHLASQLPIRARFPYWNLTHRLPYPLLKRRTHMTWYRRQWRMRVLQIVSHLLRNGTSARIWFAFDGQSLLQNCTLTPSTPYRTATNPKGAGIKASISSSY